MQQRLKQGVAPEGSKVAYRSKKAGWKEMVDEMVLEFLLVMQGSHHRKGAQQLAVVFSEVSSVS